MAACTACDGVLRTLEVQTVAPPRVELPALLARVGSPAGLATAVVTGVVGGAAALPLPLIDWALGLAYLALLSGTYFNVVDHIACGKPGFPAPVENEGWAPWQLVQRGMLLVFGVFVPFGLWFAATPGAEGVHELAARAPVVAAALLAVGLAWLSAAILSMLDHTRALAGFWPAGLIAVVAKSPRVVGEIYMRIVLTTALLWLARRLLVAAIGATGFLSVTALATLTALGLFAQAALVGGVVRANRGLYGVRYFGKSAAGRRRVCGPGGGRPRACRRGAGRARRTCPVADPLSRESVAGLQGGARRGGSRLARHVATLVFRHLRSELVAWLSAAILSTGWSHARPRRLRVRRS